jgi:hypothetical protein
VTQVSVLPPTAPVSITCAFGDPDARRDAAGSFRAAIVLLEEVPGPIGDAVSDRLVELGLAVPLRA